MSSSCKVAAFKEQPGRRVVIGPELVLSSDLRMVQLLVTLRIKVKPNEQTQISIPEAKRALILAVNTQKSWRVFTTEKHLVDDLCGFETFVARAVEFGASVIVFA
jgi:hypothetical protein